MLNLSNSTSKLFKSPQNKIKSHIQIYDDSQLLLDKYNKSKNFQSCRRITTQQSDKIIKKSINNHNVHNKIIKNSSKNNKNPNKQYKQSSNIKKQFMNQSISLNKLFNNNNRSIKYINNSVKLIKSSQKSLFNSSNHNNINNSTQNIQKLIKLFSPKINKTQNQSSLIKNKQLFSKSTLKKVGGKNNNSIKVNKSMKQQEKITPFNFNNQSKIYTAENKFNNSNIINMNTKQHKYQQKSIKNDNKHQRSMKNNEKSLKAHQKSLKIQQTKPKTFKTQQNQLQKQRNSSKRQKNLLKKNHNKAKIYHKLKMKTQHSLISNECQSTPSQMFIHDIQILQQIGQGTFGKVYKAMLKKNSQIIAIKKVFQDKKYKNRQVQIVSLLNSQFIMKVLGTYITYQQGKQFLNIIMRHYPTDLYKQISSLQSVPILRIKVLSYQLFRGLLYLHSKNICHRDIKPQNILINNICIGICDFGSAKLLIQNEKNLPYICSRCYRAPELIFGSTQYNTMIDIWSVGCVIIEMINGQPFFIGNSSIDHLIQIIKVLGTPTKTQVKQMNPQYDLKDYKFPNIKSKSLYKTFPNTDPLLINLLQQIMIYAPKQRLNAAEALVHQFFDQLREQQKYYQIIKQYPNLPDLFDFTEQQIKGNQHLYPQLVPEWYKSTNYQNQNYEAKIQQQLTVGKYHEMNFYV